MKKVLIYVPNRKFFSNYGGVGGHITHLLGVVEGLCKNGCRVTLLVSQDVLRYNYHELENISDLRVGTFKNILFFAGLKNLIKLIQSRNDYDFFYVRYSQSNLIFLWLLSLVINKKMVLEVNSFGSNYRKWMRLPEKIFLIFVRNTLCISEQIAETAKSLQNSKSKILVIPNGVSERKIATKSYEFSSNLCYIGVLKQGYGLERFFDSFVSSRLHAGSTKLFVFGGGPELKRLRNTYESKGITFYGPESWANIKTFLIKTNPILVYPSVEKFNFQSPIKMYEYLSSGLPVIAQQSENIRAMHRDFPLFEVGDLNCPNHLYEIVNKLISDPQSAQINAETALEKIKLTHTWKIRMDELIKCLSA